PLEHPGAEADGHGEAGGRETGGDVGAGGQPFGTVGHLRRRATAGESADRRGEVDEQVAQRARRQDEEVERRERRVPLQRGVDPRLVRPVPGDDVVVRPGGGPVRAGDGDRGGGARERRPSPGGDARAEQRAPRERDGRGAGGRWHAAMVRTTPVAGIRGQASGGVAPGRHTAWCPRGPAHGRRCQRTPASASPSGVRVWSTRTPSRRLSTSPASRSTVRWWEAVDTATSARRAHSEVVSGCCSSSTSRARTWPSSVPSASSASAPSRYQVSETPWAG